MRLTVEISTNWVDLTGQQPGDPAQAGREDGSAIDHTNAVWTGAFEPA
jgi:hypothetical protein